MAGNLPAAVGELQTAEMVLQLRFDLIVRGRESFDQPGDALVVRGHVRGVVVRHHGDEILGQ